MGIVGDVRKAGSRRRAGPAEGLRDRAASNILPYRQQTRDRTPRHGPRGRALSLGRPERTLPRGVQGPAAAGRDRRPLRQPDQGRARPEGPVPVPRGEDALLQRRRRRRASTTASAAGCTATPIDFLMRSRGPRSPSAVTGSPSTPAWRGRGRAARADPQVQDRHGHASTPRNDRRRAWLQRQLEQARGGEAPPISRVAASDRATVRHASGSATRPTTVKALQV